MKTITAPLLTVFILPFLLTVTGTAAETIFWEAESSSDTNMSTNGGVKPFTRDEASKLSGRNWFNGRIADTAAYAHYTVQAPVAGTYRFYVRKYWQHGPFRWRIDDGDWTEARKLKLLDSVVMRQYVPITWAMLGEVSLTAGEHKIDIETINDPAYEFNKAYGFDCFLLTTGDWEEYMQANPNLTSQAQ